jgi:hypothetical protein
MSELLLAFDGVLLVSEHEGSPLDAAPTLMMLFNKESTVNCQ